MAEAPLSTIGVIADTHGLLRPEALEALAGCESIIHAGDVGSGPILATLGQLAPVVAVRGNVDRQGAAAALPATEVVTVHHHRHPWDLYVLHILGDLDLDPVEAGFAAVVYGHTHRPAAEVEDGVLYFNPGSAGPRRFQLPITVGKLHVTAHGLESEIIDLGL